jgi:hypothetical protein
MHSAATKLLEHKGILVCVIVGMLVFVVFFMAHEIKDPKSDYATKKTEGRAVLGPPEERFRLTVSLAQRPRRSAFRVKAEVVNISDKPFGWDKEFAVFLYWRLLTPDGKLLYRQVVEKDLEKTNKALGRERFVNIEPGGRLSKVVNLTEGFREFMQQPIGGMPGVKEATKFTAHENIVRYEIPKTVARVQLSLQYQTDLGAVPGFRAMFGFDESEANLLIRQVDSNELEVKFED